MHPFNVHTRAPDLEPIYPTSINQFVDRRHQPHSRQLRTIIVSVIIIILPFSSISGGAAAWPERSEENVWKLCEQVRKTRPAELAKCYAVFVSNEGRTVPLWRQKAGRGDDKVVIWVSECACGIRPYLQTYGVCVFECVCACACIDVWYVV